jgi:hypothetical protein
MKDLAGAALSVDGTLNGTGPGHMAAARHAASPGGCHVPSSRRVLSRESGPFTSSSLPADPPTLTATEHTPDHVREPRRPDGLGGRVQLGQCPPAPCGDAVGSMHGLNAPDFPAGLVSPR